MSYDSELTNNVNSNTVPPEVSSALAAHPSFKFVRTETIESLGVEVAEYEHIVTGAKHYHMASDNTENVFLVALRTIPTDSTGVAHILEHTALCGSERYPVRDPFFMMIRRSLNTFMNAFTSSDWTAYPFASQNKKDYFNLLDVYLDAVFFSRLDEMDFAQEGHRLEFAEPSNPESELTYKGVVFNEMKGAMSSPVSTLWQTLSKHLFGTSTYHYNSGGDPECIPDLSYQELKDFYSVHYHPSNAVFMTFGDLPAATLQERFEELALKRFEHLDRTITVTDEKRYYAPVRVEEPYALDDGNAEKKTHVVMGWLLGHSINLQEQLEAELLSRVLLDNSASPLRKVLETSELGASPSPLCGLEDSNREMSFMCGMEATDPQHAAAIEAMILRVLEEVAEEGVPQSQVEAVLHQLELSQREVGGDSYPYGLQLILAGLSTAVHRGDPIGVLNLDPVLDDLAEQIKDPKFIPSLVRRYLLDNPHRVTLTLSPSTELSARREAAEKMRLAQIKSTLDDQQKAQIVEQAAALEARQMQHDDESILPKVGLEDIPQQLSIPEGESLDIAGSDFTYYGQGTNGLVYQQVIISLPKLTERQLQLLPFVGNYMPELAAGDKDYQHMQAWQSSVSGGINGYSSVRGKVDDAQNVDAYFTLSGKALARNSEALSELMKTIFADVRFDEYSRIRELISMSRSRREQSITGSGHSLAMSAAAAGFSPAAQLSHNQSGLQGIVNIKALDDSLADDETLKTFCNELEELHQLLLNSPRQFLCVAETERKEEQLAAMEKYWGSLPVQKGSNAFDLDPVNNFVQQVWSTSTQVNFCAKAFPTVPVDHKDAAALTVLGGFLRNGFLHRAIREQGGAYGGGASQDSSTATFRFFSYRDPRLTETLEDFDASIEWLIDSEHADNKLEEAVMGVISSIDKPGSPAGEAKQAFHNGLFGRDPEQRRQFRSRVLDVSIDDLKRVTKTYLQEKPASVAVITDPQKAEQLVEAGYELHNV